MTAAIQNEYEKDFYAWTFHHADLLRHRKFEALDIDNIAEEIESMGKSVRRELINRLAILLAHLLKWQFQSERRSNSWRNTIEEQRDEISELIEDSPSLTYALEEKLARAYKRAALIASTETGLNRDSFPESCPFTLSNALDVDFFP
jgi:hypothetical protein